MARLTKAYRSLWGLERNPFPDHAIASDGDHQQAFYEKLYPKIGTRMARAFLGTDGATPRVAFLWSLGSGEEARGYGKTRHLLWFAGRVNDDLGREAMMLAGRPSDSGKLVAAYASFSTVEGLSLSNFLFDVALNLARSQGERLVALRTEELAKGKTKSDIYEGALKRIRKSEESWSPGLLSSLCHKAPADWIEYLDSFRQWHKVRYGREMLRAVVAFLNELGIGRLLLLVDQVEDFASYNTPTYKLQRDFHRLAHLCSADKLLRNRVTFVLTMHPRSARILARYWPEVELGPINVDEGTENVVQLGAMSKRQFVELVKAYLESVRIESSHSPLKPFTEEVIDLIHEHERGKPGYCLQRLFYVMDLAAAAGMKDIDKIHVERCLAEGAAP